MVLSERQVAIVELIRESGYQTVEALAERFTVTPQTIRRDINQLCESHILRRLHGGAELLAENQNLSYDTRRVTRLEAKRRIARSVRTMIPNHASLFLGIGTTPEQVAVALADHEDLMVVTNNLNVALALSGNLSCRIIVAGGKLRLPDRDLVGEEVEALFASYKVDFGIFGVGAIDEDGTLLDFDPAEVRAREAIRANCRTSILVADVSKFGCNASVRGGTLEDVDWLVTDSPLPGPVQRQLSQGRPRVLVAASSAEVAADQARKLHGS